MIYKVSTLNERSDLLGKVAELDDKSWPLFLQNGDATSWARLYDELSDSVLVLTQGDELIAVGFTVPVVWDSTAEDLPDTIEDILKRGLEVKSKGLTANTLIPIGALVDSNHQGKGLSSKVLCEMKELAFDKGLKSLVVPVRPTRKSLYPLLNIEEYSQLRNDEGLSPDPWIRVHQRLGAEIIKTTESTLKVMATIDKWKEWTGAPFPESGQYIIEGALSPVLVELENNVGEYNDPNVWMIHPMDR